MPRVFCDPDPGGIPANQSFHRPGESVPVYGDHTKTDLTYSTASRFADGCEKQGACGGSSRAGFGRHMTARREVNVLTDCETFIYAFAWP